MYAATLPKGAKDSTPFARKIAVAIFCFAVAAVLAAVVWAEQAQATHTVSRGSYFYWSSACLYEKATTDPDGGTAWGLSETWSYSGGSSSAYRRLVESGWLSTKAVVWEKSHGSWYVYRSSGWVYNSLAATYLYVWARGSNAFNVGSGTDGYGSVWANGAWRTTYAVWSGCTSANSNVNRCSG